MHSAGGSADRAIEEFPSLSRVFQVLDFKGVRVDQKKGKPWQIMMDQAFADARPGLPTDLSTAFVNDTEKLLYYGHLMSELKVPSHVLGHLTDGGGVPVFAAGSLRR